MIQEQSHGRMELSDFEVTDTLTRDHHYLVEFAGRVEFVEDARWLIGGFKTMDHSKNFTGWDKLFAISQNAGSDYESGEQVEFRGRMVFEQTDSGWRVARVDI